MKTSDILKYPHEIDPEIAEETAQLMRGLLSQCSEIHLFSAGLDVATHMAAWDHLTSAERAAWKTMDYLGKVYAGN